MTDKELHSDNIGVYTLSDTYDALRCVYTRIYLFKYDDVSIHGLIGNARLDDEE